MGEQRQGVHRRPRRGRRPLAVLAVAALLPLGGVLQPINVVAEGEPPSAGAAQWLDVGLLPLDVAGLAYAHTEYAPVGANEADWDSLNASLLGALSVDLGAVTLPLVKDPEDPEQAGLLDLGNLGVLRSYSNSPSPNWATAATGLLTDNGSLDLSAYSDPTLSNSQLDLTALLNQVLGPGSDALLSTAAIEVGAVGSQITAGNLDAEGIEQCTFSIDNQYVLTDLKLDVESPLIGSAVTAINDPTTGILSTNVIDPLDALLGSGGGIESLVNGVLAPIEAILNALDLGLVEVNGTAGINSLSIDTSALVTSVQQVLAEPLESSDGSIRIDLQTGQIWVDLGKYAVENANAGKPESEWVDLSSLPANTEVLDAETISAILNGVTDLLSGDASTNPNSLVSKLITAVNEGVYNSLLDISLQIAVETCPLVGPCLTVLDVPVTITGTLGGFMGEAGYDAPVIDVSQLTIAGIPAGLLAEPVVLILQGLVTSIGSLLNTVVADPNTGILANFQRDLVGPTGVITTLVDGLVGDSGALKTLLENVATITINRQPDVGDLGAGSYTVRALEVVLLPNVTENGAVPVQLASSTALASPPACLTIAKSLVQESQFTWASQALPGDWVLTGASTHQTVTGVTGAATVTAVPVAPGEYTVSEAVGPAGITGGLAWNAYDNSWACVDGAGTPLPLVEAGGAESYTTGTLTLASGGVVTCTVTNTLTTAALAWQKVDASAPGVPLTGSAWTVTPAVNPDTVFDVADVNEATDPGEFKVSGLPPGTYELTETQSPVGYRQLTEPLTLTVNPDGTVTGLPTDGNIVNEQVPVPGIPLTGAWGAEVFYAAGMIGLLAALGTAIWGARRRTRQRE